MRGRDSGSHRIVTVFPKFPRVTLSTNVIMDIPISISPNKFYVGVLIVGGNMLFGPLLYPVAMWLLCLI